MRLLIHTDLEGAAMVFTHAQCLEAGPAKDQAMRLLTAEVNACVDGILDEEPGAAVAARDCHGPGGMDFATFTEKARLIAGRGTGHLGLDESTAGLFFVGQHARAGTPGAHLAHTCCHVTIEEFRLNGEPVGEFELHALRAGTVFGVPAVFLSGDDKAVAEARALVPELVGVAVKEGLKREAAGSLAPARARALIREGAREAMRRLKAGRIPPARREGPYELAITVRPGQEAALEKYRRCGGEPEGERTVVFRSGDPRAILRTWPDLRGLPA